MALKGYGGLQFVDFVRLIARSSVLGWGNNHACHGYSDPQFRSAITVGRDSNKLANFQGWLSAYKSDGLNTITLVTWSTSRPCHRRDQICL